MTCATCGTRIDAPHLTVKESRTCAPNHFTWFCDWTCLERFCDRRREDAKPLEEKEEDR
jgi:hypothetical protein